MWDGTKTHIWVSLLCLYEQTPMILCLERTNCHWIASNLVPHWTIWTSKCPIKNKFHLLVGGGHMTLFPWLLLAELSEIWREEASLLFSESMNHRLLGTRCTHIFMKTSQSAMISRSHRDQVLRDSHLLFVIDDCDLCVVCMCVRLCSVCSFLIWVSQWRRVRSLNVCLCELSFVSLTAPFFRRTNSSINTSEGFSSVYIQMILFFPREPDRTSFGFSVLFYSQVKVFLVPVSYIFTKPVISKNNWTETCCIIFTVNV